MLYAGDCGAASRISMHIGARPADSMNKDECAFMKPTILTRTFLLFIFAAALAIAQPIPGRYIVEFNSEPAVAVSVAARARFQAADQSVTARKAQIRAEQDAAELSINALG